jgi:hypothetical protein
MKIKELSEKNENDIHLKNQEIQDLENQVRDLMLHFEAANIACSDDSMKEGSLMINPLVGNSNSNKRKGRKK